MKQIHALWGNLFKGRPENHGELCDLLRRIPLFCELRRSELREIERLVHRRNYQDNEVIFWEDEPGVGMYIVQRGAVEIFKDFSKPGQKELARLQPGEFFGELALLEGDCRSATAVAAGETDLFSLIHPDLFDLFDRKPRLGIRLLSTLAAILAQRLRQIDQDVQRLSQAALANEGKPQ